MDARGYFESSLPPLRQNQYGASVGGPVSIPKLYNGKNRTFFYAAWEGYRFRSASKPGAWADGRGAQRRFQRPERTHLRSGNDHVQIRQPVHTRAPCSLATSSPANRIDPISAAYQSLIPHAGPLVNGNNLYSSGPQQTNQDTGTVRGDQNFGNNNQVMFRYSQFDQQVANTTNVIGENIDPCSRPQLHWPLDSHVQPDSTFSDVYFGRNYG